MGFSREQQQLGIFNLLTERRCSQSNGLPRVQGLASLVSAGRPAGGKQQQAERPAGDDAAAMSKDSLEAELPPLEGAVVFASENVN